MDAAAVGLAAATLVVFFAAGDLLATAALDFAGAVDVGTTADFALASGLAVPDLVDTGLADAGLAGEDLADAGLAAIGLAAADLAGIALVDFALDLSSALSLPSAFATGPLALGFFASAAA